MMETKRKTEKKKVVKEEMQPKKLSKAGQWFRDHPHGLDGVVIYDRRILDGLSPFDPDYHIQPQ